MQFSYKIEQQGDTQIISIRRGYATARVKVRIHQQSFRDIVMRAYRSTCSFCRLKHAELLDAAHIIPVDAPRIIKNNSPQGLIKLDWELPWTYLSETIRPPEISSLIMIHNQSALKVDWTGRG